MESTKDDTVADIQAKTTGVLERDRADGYTKMANECKKNPHRVSKVVGIMLLHICHILIIQSHPLSPALVRSILSLPQI